MATLRERLSAHVRGLQAERRRIQETATRDVAAVDEKLAVLSGAEQVITPEVEQAYTALVALGLIREV